MDAYKLLKDWGWDYNITMTKSNAIRDIFLSIFPFVAVFLLFGNWGCSFLFLLFLGYVISCVIADFLFIWRLDVLLEFGCLLSILWIIVSPIIGVIYLPIMFKQALKRLRN